MNEKKIHEPLVHVTKRAALDWWKSLLIRIGAIVLAVIVGTTVYSGVEYFIKNADVFKNAR